MGVGVTRRERRIKWWGAFLADLTASGVLIVVLVLADAPTWGWITAGWLTYYIGRSTERVRS